MNDQEHRNRGETVLFPNKSVWVGAHGQGSKDKIRIKINKINILMTDIR